MRLFLCSHSAVIEESTDRGCHIRLHASLIWKVKYCTNDHSQLLVEGDKTFSAKYTKGQGKEEIYAGWIVLEPSEKRSSWCMLCTHTDSIYSTGIICRWSHKTWSWQNVSRIDSEDKRATPGSYSPKHLQQSTPPLHSESALSQTTDTYVTETSLIKDKITSDS